MNNIKTPDSEGIKVLKENFHTFLIKKFPGEKEERYREYKNWAFTHLRHNIGINFWDSLRSEENLNICHQCYYNILSNGGFSGRGVQNPKSDAAAYMKAVRRLKVYFDDVYGGVDNYLKLL